MNDLSAEDLLVDTRAKLLSSFLAFTKVFYEHRTGRQFRISQPVGRESHTITICRALTKLFYGDTSNMIIQIPPRYGKSELAIHFVAWCMARYPDCNFIYVSYSHSLATKQTEAIREIMSSSLYRKIFGVELSDSSSAKDHFATTAGGSVFAAGTGGTLTGYGAGVSGVTDRFSGCLIIDDAHKPDEVTSDVMRQNVIDWFYNTAHSRLNNGARTPIMGIGQALHEEDLMINLRKTGNYTDVIIKAINDDGNALDPDKHTLRDLQEMQRLNPYVFAAQYQQSPQPAGGGIFKSEWFSSLDHEPNIIGTFVTADTAETDKNYNDATALEFWGLYKVVQAYTETEMYALHLIDAVEIWVEPKDLQSEFMGFYGSCMRHKVKPSFAAIEKKSTGTSLVSVLSTIQGLQIINVERGSKSGNKTARFLAMQPFIASKLITLPYGAKHTKMYIEHMSKITANDTHARDDLADATYDAIRVALIDKIAINLSNVAKQVESQSIADVIKNQEKLFERRSSIFGE